MADPSIYLVGESNPYGADPYFALYPEPDGCAGWRLCHLVLAMQPAAYLRVFERRNLLTGSRWRVPEARAAAAKLAAEISDESAVILFGRRVWDAWAPLLHPVLRPPWEPWTIFRGLGKPNVLVLPHPSGRNTMWERPGAFERGRALVGELAPQLRQILGARTGARS